MTIHDPGPEPVSDAGLTPTPDPPDLAILRAAEKAYWEAGGVNLHQMPFESAIFAAVAEHRSQVAAEMRQAAEQFFTNPNINLEAATLRWFADRLEGEAT